MNIVRPITFNFQVRVEHFFEVKRCISHYCSRVFPKFSLIAITNWCNAANFPLFLFCRELANGSIFHKKLKILFDKEDYQIYHFEKIAGLERIYKVCSPFPKDTLVNTEIIQGKLVFLKGSSTLVKVHALFMKRCYLLNWNEMPDTFQASKILILQINSFSRTKKTLRNTQAPIFLHKTHP